MTATAAPRYPVVDGMRGIFLLLMAVSHYEVLAPGFGALSYTWHGYADSAQGFVFVSGLTLGIVLSRRMDRHGSAAVARYCRARTWLVWRWHVGTLLFAIAASAAATDPQPLLDAAAGHPAANAVLGALLIHQPNFFGVLPLYVILLLATPALLAAMRAGFVLAVLAGSVALWLAAPVSPFRIVYEVADGFLTGAGVEGRYYQEFNVLAWQIVYVAGLVLGHLTAAGRLPLGRIASRNGDLVAAFALAALLVLAFYRNLGALDVGALAAMEARIAPYQSKWLMTDLVLFSTLIEGYLIAWILVRSGRASSRLGRLPWRIGALPAFRLLGRHSIEVFCTHLLVVFAFGLLADELAVGPNGRSALYVLGFAALFGVALFLDAARRPAAAPSAQVPEPSRRTVLTGK